MTSKTELLSFRNLLDQARATNGVKDELVVEQKLQVSIDVPAVTSALVEQFQAARGGMDDLKRRVLDRVNGLPSIVSRNLSNEKKRDFSVVIDPTGEMEPHAFQVWDFHVINKSNGKEEIGPKFMSAALTVTLTDTDFKLSIGEEDFGPEQLSIMPEEELRSRIVSAYLTPPKPQPSPNGKK